MQATSPRPVAGTQLGQVDSQFDADVAAMLHESGLRVLHQYPACGFNIGLIAERPDDHVRVAVECDGERYHVDEHGMLKIEDIERQAILERAGWRVVRIPYRKWIANPSLEVTRVLAAIDEIPAEADETDGEADASTATINSARALSGGVIPGAAGKREQVTHEQAALIEALKEGLSEEEDLFLRARDLVGSKRLTQRLRRAFESAASDLARRKLLTIEDGEWFLLPAGREATLVPRPAPARSARRRSGRQRWARYR